MYGNVSVRRAKADNTTRWNVLNAMVQGIERVRYVRPVVRQNPIHFVSFPVAMGDASPVWENVANPKPVNDPQNV
jgi:hypothetical protein